MQRHYTISLMQCSVGYVGLYMFKSWQRHYTISLISSASVRDGQQESDINLSPNRSVIFRFSCKLESETTRCNPSMWRWVSDSEQLAYVLKRKVMKFKSVNGRCQILWRHRSCCAKRAPLPWTNTRVWLKLNLTVSFEITTYMYKYNCTMWVFQLFANQVQSFLR